MYPEVRRLLPELEDDVLESYEEHHVADVLVMELAALKPGDERFEAKTTVLIENVRHHMDEEEQDWFPKVRDGLSRTQLRDLGEQLLAAKKKAPRSPGPAQRPQEGRRRGRGLRRGRNPPDGRSRRALPRAPRRPRRTTTTPTSPPGGDRRRPRGDGAAPRLPVPRGAVGVQPRPGHRRRARAAGHGREHAGPARRPDRPSVGRPTGRPGSPRSSPSSARPTSRTRPSSRRCCGASSSCCTRPTSQPWDPRVSDDPANPHFAFSVGGTAFFVVGLHPQASRIARRTPCPPWSSTCTSSSRSCAGRTGSTACVTPSGAATPSCRGRSTRWSPTTGAAPRPGSTPAAPCPDGWAAPASFEDEETPT